MTKLLRIALIAILCQMTYTASYAQYGWRNCNVAVSIPTVSLVAIRGATNTDISLGLTGPAEAGLGATNQSDSTMWINYSFIKGTFSRTKNDVYVKIGSGTVPTGMYLKVRAKSSSNHGRGNKGVPVGEITLTGTDQKIIKNIRSSYTGRGWKRGHNLVYTLDATNYNLVNYTDPIVLTITYTITD